MAHIGERDRLPRLHMNLVKREKTAQLNVLLTGGGLRGFLKELNEYAVGMLATLTTSFIGKSLGFDGSCELTPMSV